MTSKSRILTCFVLLVTILMPLHLCGSNASGELGLKTVVIDPGHGGKDPGALGSRKNMHEKHIVLAVSKLLGDKIKSAFPDVKVVYTRSNDTFIGLHDRAMTARKNNADLFISIHCNGSRNKDAKGTSVHILGQRSNNSRNKTDYFERNMSVAQQENSVIVLEDDYQTKYQNFDPDSPESYISHQLQWMAFYESSLLFASEVVDNLIAKPLTPRKIVIDQDIFQVLVEANMPAVLLELAFVTNPTEYKYLASTAGQDAVAERLFKAFKSYKAKYDASVKVNTDKPVAKTEDKTVRKSASENNGAFYAVQVMGLKRKMKADDPAFKGLNITAVSPVDGGAVYKYVTSVSKTLEEARSSLAAVKKKFPDAFLVKVTGNKVERIK